MIKVHNEIPQWDTPPIEVSHDGNDVSHGGVNVSHGGFHVSHGGTIPWRMSMYPMAEISFTHECNGCNIDVDIISFIKLLCFCAAVTPHQ